MGHYSAKDLSSGRTGRPDLMTDLRDVRKVDAADLGDRAAVARLTHLADEREVQPAGLTDRRAVGSAELQDSGGVVVSVLGDGRAGRAADHEYAGHVGRAALVQDNRRPVDRDDRLDVGVLRPRWAVRYATGHE